MTKTFGTTALNLYKTCIALAFAALFLTLNIHGMNVSITKTVSPTTTVNPGDTLTYTITITNIATSQFLLQNIRITDTLQQGTNYIINTGMGSFNGGTSQALQPSITGNTLTFTAPYNPDPSNPCAASQPGNTRLAPTQSYTVTFQVLVDPC